MCLWQPPSLQLTPNKCQCPLHTFPINPFPSNEYVGIRGARTNWLYNWMRLHCMLLLGRLLCKQTVAVGWSAESRSACVEDCYLCSPPSLSLCSALLLLCCQSRAAEHSSPQQPDRGRDDGVPIIPPDTDLRPVSSAPTRPLAQPGGHILVSHRANKRPRSENY